MRPLRHLIPLLAIALAIVLGLLRPEPGRAGSAPTTSSVPQPAKPEPRLTRQLLSRAPVGSAPLRFGMRIVAYAKHFLGIPYVWGGDSPSGFDCSGLVRYVYAHFGIALPHSSYADLGLGRSVPRRHLEPGDLVFFADASHVGIYAGRNRFVEAPYTGAVVRVTTLQGWYGAAYDGARRLHY